MKIVFITIFIRIYKQKNKENLYIHHNGKAEFLLSKSSQLIFSDNSYQSEFPYRHNASLVK